jgi:pre-mRNA-processing factor 8
LIGVQRAKDLAGSFESPNDFMKFESEEVMNRHPLKAYCRYIDKFYAVFKFSRQEAEDLVERYLKENPDPLNENLLNYPTKKCWPKNQRMRLMKFDVNLGRAIFWELKNRLPQSLTTLIWDKSFVSVYSNKNPNLLFEMCGFEIRIQPRIRTDPEDFVIKDGVWKLVNAKSK